MWLQKRPVLSSLMGMAQKDSNPGQSSILYLTMIHMNMISYDSYESKQLRLYMSSHDKKYTLLLLPIITFDQTFW